MCVFVHWHVERCCSCEQAKGTATNQPTDNCLLPAKNRTQKKMRAQKHKDTTSLAPNSFLAHSLRLGVGGLSLYGIQG